MTGFELHFWMSTFSISTTVIIIDYNCARMIINVSSSAMVLN